MSTTTIDTTSIDTTIDTTDDTGIDTADRADARTTRQRRRPGRMIRLAALALLAAAVGAGISADRADAMIIGGSNTGPIAVPGNISAELYCSSGRFSIYPMASVQNGYVNGQYAMWQYSISNSAGWSEISNWSGYSLLGYNNYYQQPVTGPAVRNAVSGVTWNAKIRVAYWTGSGWWVSQWYTAGKKQAGYSDWQQYCWT